MKQDAIPGPTRFVCAVCDLPQPLAVEGKLGYTEAGNGNRICLSCVNRRDQKAIDEGKGITLSLVREGDNWFAANPTDKIRMQLKRKADTMSEAQMVGSPMFVHKGRRWTGRFYPASGTAYFAPLKETAGKPTANGAAKKREASPEQAKIQVRNQRARQRKAPPARRKQPTLAGE